MLAEILPPEVFVAEVLGEEYDQGELFPQEEAAIARAVAKRRREFTAVRVCARAAFARAGIEAAPVVPGSGGAPQWPAGVVGSMTHCAGFRGCAIGRAEQVAAIGVDAEPHDDLPDGVLDMVTSESERAALALLRQATPSISWDRILFCAKESVYKAWFPVTGAWLGFEDADVTIDPAGTFVAKLLVPWPVLGGRPITAYHGRWQVRDGLIATAIAVPAELSRP